VTQRKGTQLVSEPIVLTDMERMAAIRAYNSMTKHELTRSQMIDWIIQCINEERASVDVP
jgi:hypothetical protein